MAEKIRQWKGLFLFFDLSPIAAVSLLKLRVSMDGTQVGQITRLQNPHKPENNTHMLVVRSIVEKDNEKKYRQSWLVFML